MGDTGSNYPVFHLSWQENTGNMLFPVLGAVRDNEIRCREAPILKHSLESDTLTLVSYLGHPRSELWILTREDVTHSGHPS